MTAVSTQLERDVSRIFGFLMDEGTYEGTMEEMSVTLGIQKWRIVSALHEIRSAAFIEEHGWTIPNVRKGLATKAWTIAEAKGDYELLRDATRDIRMPEIQETARRLLAMIDLSATWVDKRSAEGRRVQRASTMVAAAVEALEDVPVPH